MSGPTLLELRMLVHACAADHPRSPGYRNYLALNPSDPDAVSMEKKGLIVKTSSYPGGLAYFVVAKEWRQALVCEREGRRFIDVEDLQSCHACGASAT